MEMLSEGVCVGIEVYAIGGLETDCWNLCLNDPACGYVSFGTDFQYGGIPMCILFQSCETIATNEPHGRMNLQLPSRTFKKTCGNIGFILIHFNIKESLYNSP